MGPRMTQMDTDQKETLISERDAVTAMAESLTELQEAQVIMALRATANASPWPPRLGRESRV
jgi:hypothetical protein